MEVYGRCKKERYPLFINVKHLVAPAQPVRGTGWQEKQDAASPGEVRASIAPVTASGESVFKKERDALFGTKRSIDSCLLLKRAYLALSIQ